MPIRITEIESCNEKAELQDCFLDPGHPSNAATLLKVEGTLYLRDAELLEKICSEVSDQTSRWVILDLSDICFLDTASAAVLCRMKREKGIEIRGLNLFIKKVVELADKCQREYVEGSTSQSRTKRQPQ